MPLGLTGSSSVQQDSEWEPLLPVLAERRDSISTFSGNRPSFSFEKIVSPPAVISNRPLPDGTSVKREIPVLYFSSTWRVKLTAWSSYPHMEQ